MLNVSSAWHRALWNDKRDYIEQAKITLTDDTVLNLTNENIWGGIKIDDAVSSDSDFQIGAAIINKLNFSINNIYDEYNEYDFGDAEVEAKIGLVTDTNTEIIKKGKFIVNTATHNGSLINLECYDYMSKFEKPYSGSTLVYPATLDTIVRGACTDCGVTLGTLNFPHKTYTISTRPSDENATYREVIAWCAQIAGCFARCDVDGKLELKWYNQSAIGDGANGLNGGIFDDDDPYSSGDTADGGTFNPWNTGYEYDAGLFSASSGAHYINTLYSKNISVDDVIITGVRIVVKTDGNTTLAPTLVGTTGYMVEISNNPMINSDNVSEIATWLGTQLIGFKFRKAQITHGSDPSIEAGDVAFVIDGKGNIYPIVISHTVFSVGASQSTVSSAQTPARNSASRVSNETKNYVELRKAIKTERTARQQAEYDLAQAIASASGLYLTTVTDSQTEAVTYYLHNKSSLNESAIRMMFSDAGITVTADSGAHWYGLTTSGDMILNLLSTTGINADWINTGKLVVEDGQGNETLFVDADSGVVRIAPTVFSLTTANISTIESKAASAANTAKADAISTAASDATSKANTAEQNAKDYSDGKLSAFKNGDFATFVTNTGDALNGKITTFYASSTPTANVVGDLWIDTTDSANTLKRWNGTTWENVQDAGIQAALSAASNAQTTADGKIMTYAQASAPSDDLDIGDLWIDTSNNNAMSRWNGTAWVPYTDTSALEAYKTTVNGYISGLQAQIDSQIEEWFVSTTPTESNYPASDWTTDDVREKHLGDLCYNKSNGKVYKYVFLEGGIKLKFSSQSATESPSSTRWYDYVQIYYEKDGKTYATQKYGGYGSSNNIANAEVFIPASTFKLHWNTDASQHDYYGFAIDSVTAATGNNTGTEATLPTGATEITLATGVYPESEHSPYSDSINNLYICDSGITIASDSYSWVEITDSDIQSVLALAAKAEDTADGKRRVFTSTPTPPYETGDLWTQGSSGDIYRCKANINKTSSDSYSASDWELASKYTDDTTALTVYGTCSTGSITAAKEVTLSGFVLHPGSRVAVKFSNANAVADATLNVNSTGAITIKAYGSNLTATSAYNWVAGAVVEFVYDGYYWQMVDGSALSKIGTLDSSLNQQEIFDRLTNNSSNQGIFLENGNLYLNMTYAKTGTLIVGGSATNAGVIEIKDNNDVRVGRWDKTGLYIGNIASTLTSPKTKIDTDGAITTGSLTANDYIYVNGNNSSYFKVPSGSNNYTEISSNGFIVKSNGMYAKLSAPDEWIYHESYSPDGTEIPDDPEGEDMVDRPGLYGLNTIFRAAKNSSAKPTTYTAIGRDYIEIANGTNVYRANGYSKKGIFIKGSSNAIKINSSYYDASGYVNERKSVLASNKLSIDYSGSNLYYYSELSHQNLILAYENQEIRPSENAYDYIKLSYYGFTKVRYQSVNYSPVNTTITIGNTTYRVVNGIFCYNA